MRKVHRYVAVFAVFLAIWFACTGIAIHAMDLGALLARAPASDPTMQAIRVGINGPPNFQVIRDTDYAAEPLPGDFDFAGKLGTITRAGRAAARNAPLSFVELRMADGKPIGQVASDGKIHRIDAATGAVIGSPVPIELRPVSSPSARNTVKSLHAQLGIGPVASAIALLSGVSLLVMIYTGFALYLELLRARRRMKRDALFWKAGGWWRTLHRAIGASAALFIAIIALTGSLLAINAIGINVSKALQGGKRPGLTQDVSAPLSDAQLPAMLHATLAAYRASQPGGGVRVLRLRHFAGMPQGIVITGERDARQIAFNAATGERAALYEPGYPDTDMPFGWQVGQTAKQIHRGDIIGLSGRWLALLAGLSLLYLAVSGGAIYLELWKRRRQRGHKQLFWS